MDFSQLDFSTSSYHKSINIGPTLPKTNTTFHQLFKYVKKDAIFSTIRRENNRNIFVPRSLIDTVILWSVGSDKNAYLNLCTEKS